MHLERNNCIRVGARLAHFLQNVVHDECTFFRINNPNTVNRETFIHFFSFCTVTTVRLRGLSRTAGIVCSPELDNF
jgi:hypothetical protein